MTIFGVTKTETENNGAIEETYANSNAEMMAAGVEMLHHRFQFSLQFIFLS